MDIGCQLPMQGPVASRDALMTFARQAEAHDMASLWVSDHVVFPYTSSGYPGGRFPHPRRCVRRRHGSAPRCSSSAIAIPC
jgi:alkanesulfonate monooxygenase SsuD/methylene tetrahydromethanopterin reductase-like flavin-dependent oxidoreductase (luciferase family)